MDAVTADELKAFGRRVRRARELIPLTQKQADTKGASTTIWQQIEGGDEKVLGMRDTTFVVVARRIGLDPESLLDEISQIRQRWQDRLAEGIAEASSPAPASPSRRRPPATRRAGA